MKLFFKFFIFLSFFILNNFYSLHAKEYRATYLIEVKTVNIGKLLWNINISKNNYKMSLKLEDKGFFSGIYKFNGKYETSGLIVNNSLKPIKYKQTWITKKKERKVIISFNGDSLEELWLFPKEKEQPRIQYIGVQNFLDPLSSFLNLLIGKNNSKTIDGRRVYTLVVDEKNKKDDTNIRKIFIKNYINIWADHKRKDLEYIEIVQHLDENDEILPIIIYIKFKNILFKLSKI